MCTYTFKCMQTYMRCCCLVWLRAVSMCTCVCVRVYFTRSKSNAPVFDRKQKPSACSKKVLYTLKTTTLNSFKRSVFTHYSPLCFQKSLSYNRKSSTCTLKSPTLTQKSLTLQAPETYTESEEHKKALHTFQRGVHAGKRDP